jgi:hypothetical protein
MVGGVFGAGAASACKMRNELEQIFRIRSGACVWFHIEAARGGSGPSGGILGASESRPAGRFEGGNVGPSADSVFADVEATHGTASADWPRAASQLLLLGQAPSKRPALHSWPLDTASLSLLLSLAAGPARKRSLESARASARGRPRECHTRALVALLAANAPRWTAKQAARRTRKRTASRS